MIEDMLRTCCLDQEMNWIYVLSLMKFFYNKSYQTTIQMVLCEAFYRRKNKLPFHWDKKSERNALA